MIKIVLIISLCFFCPGMIFSQPEVSLPSEINILIDNYVFDPSEAWTDSLISEARTGYLRYEIISTYRVSHQIQTKIRVPQFFTFKQVIRQIVFYYGLLDSEDARKCEKLLIYPFFCNIEDNPAAQCTYVKEGWYKFEVNYWNTVDVPKTPGPENKFLYNQLIESSMTELGDIDGISEKILKKIAAENNISVDKLQKIYEEVKLWQLAQ